MAASLQRLGVNRSCDNGAAPQTQNLLVHRPPRVLPDLGRSSWYSAESESWYKRVNRDRSTLTPRSTLLFGFEHAQGMMALILQESSFGGYIHE